MHVDGATLVIRDLGGESDEHVCPIAEAAVSPGSSGGASAGMRARPPTTSIPELLGFLAVEDTSAGLHSILSNMSIVCGEGLLGLVRATHPRIEAVCAGPHG